MFDFTRIWRIEVIKFKVWLILRFIWFYWKFTQHLSLYHQNWDLFYNHNPRRLRKFNFIENIDLIEFIERENIVEEKFVFIHSSFRIWLHVQSRRIWWDKNEIPFSKLSMKYRTNYCVIKFHSELYLLNWFSRKLESRGFPTQKFIYSLKKQIIHVRKNN